MQFPECHHPDFPLERVQTESNVERDSVPHEVKRIYELAIARACLERGRVIQPGRAYRFPWAASAIPCPIATIPSSPNRVTSASSSPSFDGTGTGTPSIIDTHIASIA